MLSTENAFYAQVDQKEKCDTREDRDRDQRPLSAVMVNFRDQITRRDIQGHTARKRKSIRNGEAQAAESPEDFIHKLKVVLKELKECRTSLKVIMIKAYIKPVSKLSDIYKETEELIAIIGKSISTAEKNKTNKKN